MRKLIDIGQFKHEIKSNLSLDVSTIQKLIEVIDALPEIDESAPLSIEESKHLASILFEDAFGEPLDAPTTIDSDGLTLGDTSDDSDSINIDTLLERLYKYLPCNKCTHSNNCDDCEHKDLLNICTALLDLKFIKYDILQSGGMFDAGMLRLIDNILLKYI